MTRIVARLHRSEGGAIALLCLASFMILLLVSFIVFDTGTTLRAKVDAKQGADTAAYSSAAVQARSMNMVAFANVGKRTVMGIHNMYALQYPMYAAWFASQCSQCCCGVYCGCWTECLNCIGNGFHLDPLIELFDFLAFLGDDDLEKNIDELHEFQTSIKDYAMYWATGEGMARGVRNGADLVGMYPPPDETTYAPLPLDEGSYIESCLSPMPTMNVITAGSALEWFLNFVDLRQRSTSRPLVASKGPREIVNPLWAFVACLIPKDNAEHIYLTKPGHSSEELFHKSTMVYSYKHEPKMMAQWKDNFDILPGDYEYSGGLTPQSGVFAVARSEFLQPYSSRPRTILDTDHSNWMFHPGWIGKNRPISLAGELPPAGHDVDQWVSATLNDAQSMALTQFGLAATPHYDPIRFAIDMNFLRNNAARDMSGRVDHGADDVRHAADGTD